MPPWSNHALITGARRLALAATTAAALTLPLTAAAAAAPSAEAGRTLHVAPGASSGGSGSESRPFRALGDALKVAQPGDTVKLAAGTYTGPFTTVRAGREGAPIRLLGTSGARIKGAKTGRLFQVLHSYITIEGLDFSGGDSLLWVQGASKVRVLDNHFHDAGGECVRVKYRAHYNEIARNTIERCGQTGFNVAAGKKNGEGIYIGTAPEQLSRNPTKERDASSHNWVHHNRINPRAECVDTKEASHDNLVEHNTCWGSQDPDGGGFSSRGRHNIFRYNSSTKHAGAGIRLGGDTATDGIGNDVIGNVVADNKGYGIKVMRSPQGKLCGNTLQRNAAGAISGKGLLPDAAC